ncbi:hypothetical protein X777_04152 [Ooceraea biroi]|uniref:Uncharacterized protein n=1 Tax=Ooceraea biroi TaxID=2015173 RepID=A0A026WID9_OOCBI|nr:hypothetical protein X777_04152 [Ooceraea biroi]
MPPPSARLQHNTLISSHSSATATQSFARNNPPASKSPLQRKQTLMSPSPATKSSSQNIHSNIQPLQHKQISSRPSQSPVQHINRPQSPEHEEWTEDKGTSPNTKQFLKIIMTQLRRMEKRQIYIINKTE